MEDLHCDMCCQPTKRNLTFNCKHIICYCCFYKIILRTSLKDIMSFREITVGCICINGKITLTQEEIYEIVYYLNQNKQEKVPSNIAKEKQNCYYHNSHKQLYFCLDCKDEICGECYQEDGNHYEHQTIKTDEYINVLKNQINHLPDLTYVLSNEQLQCDNAYLKYIDAITFKFTSLIEEINTYKQKVISHVKNFTDKYNQSMKTIDLLYKYFNYDVEQSSNDIHQLLFILNTKIVLPEIHFHTNKAESEINFLIKSIQDLKIESIVDVKLKQKFCEFKCVQSIEAHQTEISALILLSNLKLASGSYDGIIKIWKMTKKGYTLIQSEAEHKTNVLSMSQLLKQKFASSSNEGLIIWKEEDKERYIPIQRINYENMIFGIYINSLNDNKTMAVCLNNHMIAFYKETKTLEGKEDYVKFEEFKGHSSSINSIVQIGNGKLITASDDSTLRIWNEDYFFESLTGHKDCVNVLCVLDDDRIASGSSDKTIIIWIKDKKNDKFEHCKPLEGHTESIRSLVYLTDGRLISGSVDDNIKIWLKNRKEFECNMTLRNHSGGIPKIVSIDDESFISASWDKTLKIWYGIKFIN